MSAADKINVPSALTLIDDIFIDAIASGKHKPGDWRDQGEQYNLDHLVKHFDSYLNGNTDEDHLANMVCRGLCLLQLRIEKHGK